MKKYLKLLLFIMLVLHAGVSVWAKDFGLILDQSPAYGGIDSNGSFEYSGILIPRFSTPLGENGALFISAGLRLDYLNGTTFFPELLRTEFTYSTENGDFTIGRMYYSDPLGFIAEGLFDGAHYAHETKYGTFSAGAWYTGLLFKKRAYITMNSDELDSYYSDLNYSSFADTYFAPRRVVAALGWAHPGLGELLSLNLALLGQFDLNGTDLHSQYLVFKIAAPVENFIFDLGGSLELIQDSGETGIGLAGEAGIGWMLPTALEDQLSFLGRFTSGTFDGSRMAAFQPLTTKTQGDALRARLSGISMLSLEYMARLHRTFSAGLSSSYFIRSDLGTFQIYDANGYFLGNEFSGRFFWSPVSDLLVNLAAGVFLPSMGNSAPDAKPLWRIELNVILSLY